MTKKEAQLEDRRNRAPEFRITLRNKFAVFTGESEDSVDIMSDNPTKIIAESAVAVEEGIPREETGKLSQKTKALIEKHKNMAVSTANWLTSNNKIKIADIPGYNMAKLEEVLKGRSLKSTQKGVAIAETLCRHSDTKRAI